ncbi:MAG: LysE family transporter, partial [Bacillota bacterium]|nr:LysE family transporter [Bacillota bacterium]
MSNQYLFWTSLLLGFTGALVPGPLLTVTLAESARWRFAAGPALIAGHAAVEGALVLAAVKGLAVWLRL